MKHARPNKNPKKAAASSPLMVRLDRASKACLVQAAQMRSISVSDYVRTVMVAQARREIKDASEQTISLTREEQIAFWNALSAPARLTKAQKRLGALMRGEE